MLSWARTSAGLSEADVAHRLKIDESRLAAWESGADAPTVKQLQRLAAIYKRPVSVLYLSEPPHDFMALRDFRRLPGSGIHQFSPDVLYQMRRAQERREAAIDLFKELGDEPPRFTVEASMEEEPESIGLRIRELLNVTPDLRAAWSGAYDAFNFWRAAVERNGVLVFQASDIALDEMRGFSISEQPLPTIVTNMKDTPNGRTFTLIHELSHLMLRRGGVCDLDEHDRAPEDRAIEVFCNAVAGAALVPQDQFLAEPIVLSHTRQQPWLDEDLVALSQHYRVSREVVLRRLLQLSRISLSFYREKRQQFIDEYAGRPRSEGFAPPHTKALATVGRTFARLVLQNYHQEKLSLNAVSDYLGVRLKHLPKIEASVW